MNEISEPTAKLSKSQLRLGLTSCALMFLSWIFLTFQLISGGNKALPFVLALGSTVAYIAISSNNKKSILAQGGDSVSARMKTLIIIDHMAGLENHNLQQAKSAMVIPEGIVFTVSKTQKILLTWDKVLRVEAGSEEQLRSRVTLSRVLLVGVFALALKKERKQKFFLTIETTDGVGLWSINTIGKDNRQAQAKAMTFATKCNSHAKAIASTESVAISAPENADPLHQIDKLADLLSKGHITQEEFDIKKSELLDRI